MKKKDRDISLFDMSNPIHKSIKSNKVRTTDVNILLNRVRLEKKIEFKKKLIYLSLILAIAIFIGIYSLI